MRDIRTARTPSRAFYGPEGFASQREVLARSWHVVGVLSELPARGDVLPRLLLEGCLDEPLLLVHGADDRLRGFANLCTHRGALLVDQPCQVTTLRCPYHGRRFALDGRLHQAPEFEGSPDFPSEEDHLQRVAVGLWGPLIFASIDPATPFATFIAPLDRLAAWKPEPGHPAERTGYDVDAHWALWCENYLEGFHVPWVHPALARELDWRAYRTELLPGAVVQLGLASAGGVALDLAAGHPHAEEKLAGIYLHLLPTTTLNFYPWGLSVNVVEPRGPASSYVRYLSFVRDPSLRTEGAGGALDTVEREDDAIVARVQRGVGSRMYRGGRYAPNWESGLFHFHEWMRAMGAG